MSLHDDAGLNSINPFYPNEDQRKRGMTLRGSCQCTICGSPADCFGSIHQCRSNPGHIADCNTGIFSDCTYPSEWKKPGATNA